MPNNNWVTYHDEKGKECFLNLETGEIDNGVKVEFTMRTGGRYFVVSPDSDNKAKEKKKHKKRNDNPFYFLNKEIDFKAVKPATLIRLIYLNCFCGFNSNCLMITERKKMTVSDLQAVLDMDKMGVSRFLQEVSPKYLTINEDKTITPNKNIFFKGKINKKEWIRVFQESTKILYKNCDYMKQLGYIFQTLPYINHKYNVLCWNPDETEPTQIKKMTISELCDCIGYDRKHYKRLIQAYNSIIFNNNGKEERFCSFVNDGIHIQRSYILINPAVIFSGNNAEDVKIFGNFCN